MAACLRKCLVTLVAAGGLLGAVACSAVLNWDQGGLACDPVVAMENGVLRTDWCRPGYSCQVNTMRCLSDNSLKTGQACTQARQCKGGAVCPADLLEGGGKAGTDGVDSCLPACKDTGTDGGFLQAEGCLDQSEVCLPFLTTKASSAAKALVGGCYPSAGCDAGGSCDLNGQADGSCVVMSSNNVTACMQGCEITWSTTQAFSDNCDARHGCVPVGVAGKKQFACLYNATNSAATPLGAVGGQKPGAAGAPCSPVLAPCGKGYVCSQGVCAQYCQITVNNTFPCPTNQSCCPLKGFATSQATGYCTATCN